MLLLAILFGLAASPAPGGRYTLHTGQMLIQGQTQPITLRLDTVSGRCWLLGYLEAHGGVVHIWHQVDEIEEAIGLLQTQRTAPQTAPTDGKPATR